MSYDLELQDPLGKTIVLDTAHDFRGGTYQVGGCPVARLNITWNYAPHFREVLGAQGIRAIYGMTASDSVSVLARAIERLGTDTDSDYWASTPGNAGNALDQLRCLALAAPPDSVWGGD